MAKLMDKCTLHVGYIVNLALIYRNVIPENKNFFLKKSVFALLSFAEIRYNSRKQTELRILPSCERDRRNEEAANMMKIGCGAFEQEFFGAAVKGDQGGDAGDGAGCR